MTKKLAPSVAVSGKLSDVMGQGHPVSFLSELLFLLLVGFVEIETKEGKPELRNSGFLGRNPGCLVRVGSARHVKSRART